MVLRVMIAKDYNRSLAKPLFNCPECFAKKEHTKQRTNAAESKTPQPKAA